MNRLLTWLDWHLKLNWILLRELPQFDGTLEIWFNVATGDTRKVLTL